MRTLGGAYLMGTHLSVQGRMYKLSWSDFGSTSVEIL